MLGVFLDKSDMEGPQDVTLDEYIETCGELLDTPSSGTLAVLFSALSTPDQATLAGKVLEVIKYDQSIRVKDLFSRRDAVLQDPCSNSEIMVKTIKLLKKTG